MKIHLKRLIFISLLFLLALRAFPAFHLGFIHYRQLALGGNDFEIVMIVVKDSLSPPLPPTMPLIFDEPVAPGPEMFATLNKLDSVNLPNHLVQYRFADTITVPYAAKWYVVHKSCCRPPMTNMTLGFDSTYTISSMFDMSTPGLHSSARFDMPPMTFAQKGHAWYFNPGYYDPQHDSLRFSILAIKDTVGYAGTANPSWNSVPISLNDTTGEMTWTPNATGAYGLRLFVQEYNASGTEVGNTDYDMFFMVADFPSNIPTRFINTQSYPVNTTTGRFEFTASSGQLLQIAVEAQDSDGSLVEALNAGGENLTITGTLASFAPVQVNDSTMTGNLNWTPSVSDERPKPYTVVFRAQEALTGYTAFADLTVDILVSAPSSRTNDIEKISMKVYPNPSSDWVSFEFHASEAGNYQVAFHDLSGREVLSTQAHPASPGKMIILSDLSGLSAGSYIATLMRDGEPVQSGKFIRR